MEDEVVRLFVEEKKSTYIISEKLQISIPDVEKVLRRRLNGNRDKKH